MKEKERERQRKEEELDKQREAWMEKCNESLKRRREEEEKLEALVKEHHKKWDAIESKLLKEWTEVLRRATGAGGR